MQRRDAGSQRRREITYDVETCAGGRGFALCWEFSKETYFTGSHASCASSGTRVPGCNMYSKERSMRTRKKNNCMYQMRCLARAGVVLIDDDTAWRPPLSVEDAYGPIETKDARRRGDVKPAFGRMHERRPDHRETVIHEVTNRVIPPHGSNIQHDTRINPPRSARGLCADRPDWRNTTIKECICAYS
jgi:hypothetical protein